MKNNEIYIQKLSVIANSQKKGRIFKQKAELRPDTLICVIEGEIIVESGGLTKRAESGSFLYIPHNTASSTIFRGDKNSFINFFFMTPTGSIANEITVFPGNSQLTKTVGEVEKHCKAHEDNTLLFLSYLYLILFELSQVSLPDPEYQKIYPIVKRITEHPEEDLKISEYAAQVFMCEATLRKLFKKYTTKSPIHFRNSLRLQKVEGLILSGKTVEAAALDCGFKSVSFYYRCRRATVKE